MTSQDQTSGNWRGQQSGSAGHTAVSVLETVRDSVSTAVVQARDSISQSAGQATETMTTFTDELEASIERNPLTTVVLTLALGVVVGLIGSARHRF